MFAKKYKGRAIDTEELLGPSTEPKNLSMSVLQDTTETGRNEGIGDDDLFGEQLLATNMLFFDSQHQKMIEIYNY